MFYNFDNENQNCIEHFETGSSSSSIVYQVDDCIESSIETFYDSNVDSNGSAANGTATYVTID